MEKEFIPYTEALALKELGFNEPCFGWFTNSYLRIGSVVENKHVQGEDETLAPLYQQAFRWFREKYKIFPYTYTGNGNLFHYCMFIKDRDNQYHSNDLYLSNEEAELECLKKLIEIVKEK